MSGWPRLLPLLLAVGAGLPSSACEQTLQDRPPDTFGPFHPPPGGGGGEGADAGVGGDAGLPGHTVRGRVVALTSLSRALANAPGVPDRLVGAYDPSGALVTTTSAADGSFELAGVELGATTVLSVSGDPPSWVVFDRRRADTVEAPVMDAALLGQVATSVGLSISPASGQAFLWLADGRGVARAGLTGEVVSIAPAAGPFYGSRDAAQVSASPPTGTAGLMVILEVVAPEVELSVFAADDPLSTERVVAPIGAGVVTFFEVTTGL